MPSRPRAVLAALVLLGCCVNPARSAEPPSPTTLSELRLSRIKLAHDQAGRVATFDHERRALSLWTSSGKLDSSCTFPDTQTPAGILGLNDSRVLFVTPAGDHTELLVFEASECRLRAQRDLPGFAVVSVHPARDGWLLEGIDSKKVSKGGAAHRVLAITSDGKLWGSYELPDDALAGAAPTHPFGKWASPVDVSGEVWLIPQASYRFVRPRQAGREEYVFVPEGCLAADGRGLEEAEARKYASAFATGRPESPMKVTLNQRAEGTRAGQSALGAVSAVASYRSLVGVVVRPNDAATCRLDIWDLLTEKPVLVKPLKSACPASFWFSDERLFYLDDGRVIEWEFERPLYDLLQDPCTASTPPAAAKTVGPEKRPNTGVSDTPAADSPEPIPADRTAGTEASQSNSQKQPRAKQK